YSFSNLTGANILQLKFVFKSDINLTAPGVSLDDITLQGVVGLNENDNKTEFILFPNPANNNCQLIFPANTNAIELIDASGKTIDHYEVNNETSKVISMANYADGFYILRFISNNGSTTKKLQLVH
ncbi:MAG: T9SS type A sorting domain-containing protein, partial [Bacteroidota bacterium]